MGRNERGGVWEGNKDERKRKGDRRRRGRRRRLRRMMVVWIERRSGGWGDRVAREDGEAVRIGGRRRESGCVGIRQEDNTTDGSPFQFMKTTIVKRVTWDGWWQTSWWQTSWWQTGWWQDGWWQTGCWQANAILAK